ncbi:MAG: beta-glucosidase [Frankiaceae bacterium]|nr:beta-glucosidase [Frankiaceae bacterium]
MTVSTQNFPPGFVWGSATAAYQVEGAVHADGRGPSIWDTFCRVPGAVHNGDTGDIAVDQYNRYEDDVALMTKIGLHAYRFSVSWARVQPAGSGAPNAKGLDYYDRLVDALRGAGLEPFLTLYHWDLPQPLEDAGGWPSRDTAHRFADYAQLVHDRLHDRVTHWTTLNEPWCSAFLGYGSGKHAPGRRDELDAVKAAHHLLLGHGEAVTAMRAQHTGSRFGITLNLAHATAQTDSAADADAVRRIHLVQNRLFLDPVLLGTYDDELRAHVDSVGGSDHIQGGDGATIGVPLEFLGVNYYMPFVVSGGQQPNAAEPSPYSGAQDVTFEYGGRERTAMGWEVDASTFNDVLFRVHRDYPPIPIYVTENGAAYDDYSDPEGHVHDGRRRQYVHDHIAAMHDAMAAGADVRGYFLWSLLDNFEWSEGYAKRFGMVYVDYPTQTRILKDTALWYADTIRANAVAPLP